MLIVEDELEIRSSLVRILKPLFLEIYSADNGMSALEVYEKESPHIIITDIKMPKFSGTELIQKIRERDQKTPIIVISAYDDKSILLNLLSLNLTDYLVKPLLFKRLQEVLLSAAKKLVTNGTIIEELAQNSYYNWQNKTIINEANEAIHLTRKEILLIELLLKNRNSIISKERIAESVWEDSEMSEQAYKNLIYRVRQKVGKTVITSVQNFGIVMR